MRGTLELVMGLSLALVLAYATFWELLATVRFLAVVRRWVSQKVRADNIIGPRNGVADRIA